MTQVRKFAKITGIGSCFPARVVANSHFESYLDTSDEWIRSRTGVAERRIASKLESTSKLGGESARVAMADAGVEADEIDLIIGATATPDMLMPSIACMIQKDLGLHRATAFDLNAACSGFIYAMSVANAMILSGQARKILIVGADVVSPYLDYEDRNTCIIFGDAAGSVVVEGADAGGILAVHTQSLGSEWELLKVPGIGTSTDGNSEWIRDKKHVVQMDGREIFKLAVTHMAESCRVALDRANLSIDDVDWVVPHQANKRIIDAMQKKLEIDPDRVQLSINEFGNTIAATIPTTLDKYFRQGRVKPGQTILLTAFGAGLTYGSVVLRW